MEERIARLEALVAQLQTVTTPATPTTEYGSMSAADKGKLDTLRTAPYVRVRNSTNQTVPANSALLTLPWDTEDYDTDGMHDPVTNNDRLTCTVPGLYMAYVAGYWDTTGGDRTLRIMLNATTTAAQWQLTTAGNAVCVAITYLRLVAGDYLQAQVRQDTASPAAFYMATANVGILTQFAAVYLAP